MKLSFILPSYNRKEILKRVLSELSDRDYTFPYEIRVLDNNSQDGSCNMVRREFPSVHLYELEENLGAISRNIGIRDAKGEYIVMLDDDSYPLKNAVEQGIAVLDNDVEERVGCIAFNIQRADGSYETAGIHTAFTGCAAMFRKNLFAKTGGYPDNYLFYVEEYDLSCRILQAGYSILNFKELEFVHLKTQVNRDFNKNIERLIRNNLLLWSKYLPGDLAEQQIETEIWRYEKIALKENALQGYLNGLEMGKEEVRRYRNDRYYQLDRASAEKMLAFDVIDKKCAELSAADSSVAGSKNVLIYSAGKLLHLIIGKLRAAGHRVVAIVDDNVHMQATGFQGLPIIPHAEIKNTTFDAVVLGTTSLSLSDVFEAKLRKEFQQAPVLRLSEYNTLADYLQ